CGKESQTEDISMNALAFLKRPSPVALDRAIAADLERQLTAIEFDDTGDVESAPILSPAEMARQKLAVLIGDEDAQIGLLEAENLLLSERLAANKRRIEEHREAIRVLQGQGDTPVKTKPIKGKAAQ